MATDPIVMPERGNRSKLIMPERDNRSKLVMPERGNRSIQHTTITITSILPGSCI
uniref:Uncharacterized protein n=1 Tax=Solanum tuberosum TaxID=4113 RepID=M1D0Q5_SOLTU